MRSIIIIALIFAANISAAGGIVYTPNNPSFGGNPLNGGVLLNNAQAQNVFKDPNTPEPKAPLTALQQFNDRLQQAVLNKLANASTNAIFTTTGALQPGTIETIDFIIVVTSDSTTGLLTVTTTEKGTGATTSFTVAP